MKFLSEENIHSGRLQIYEKLSKLCNGNFSLENPINLDQGPLKIVSNNYGKKLQNWFYDGQNYMENFGLIN